MTPDEIMCMGCCAWLAFHVAHALAVPSPTATEFVARSFVGVQREGESLECWGGPMDGEWMEDVVFADDGTFTALISANRTTEGGSYTWCRDSHRAVWTEAAR